MCSALGDFGALDPTRGRRQHLQVLRWADDVYFDSASDEWVSEQRYDPEEANQMAQTLHRYRLVSFSNFMTTISTVKRFEPNLVDVLDDAAAGSVVGVLGGREDHYNKVYQHVDRLAESTGFQLKLGGETVSCAGSEVEGRVYEEGRQFYRILQRLSRNRDKSTEKVRSHFEAERGVRFSRSEIRAYRKY